MQRTTEVPTAEQGAIIDAGRSGAHLIIEAGAGTGKTRTLRMLADELPGTGVYVAFNKQIVIEAQQMFASRVTCATAHHLAYKAVGHRYGHRLDGPRMRYDDVAARLRLPHRTKLTSRRVVSRYDLVLQAFATVRRYCQSSEDTLLLKHVPRARGIDGAAHAEFAALVLGTAIDLWEDLGNPAGQFPFQHDHYLKMWSLLSPTIDADYVLFDEAQDADPVIAQIIQSQSCQQVAVGDRHQAIYGWRGAVDALENWPAAQRLQLTQSWRFGPAIAEEANTWLAVLGSNLRLSGNPALDSRVHATPDASAVLCRTNAEAISEVMLALQDGRRTALVGGTRPIVNLARAADDLRTTGSTGHPELFAFRSWSEVQDYAQQEDGGDLRTFVRLVDDIGTQRIMEIGDQLSNESTAEVTISTCHKAKGLQWPSVRIARDFHRQAHDNSGALHDLPREDAMLAYVAVTRAQHVLDQLSLAWIRSYTRKDKQSADAEAPQAAATAVTDIANLHEVDVRDPASGVRSCPACRQAFPSPRRSSGQCPSCGERVVIRQSGGRRFALTVEADRARTDAKLRKRQSKHILARLKEMSVGREAYLAAERRLISRIGCEPAPSAVFWELASWTAAAAVSRSDWDLATRAFHQMARQAGVDGSPWRHLSALAHQAEIRWYSRWCPDDEAMKIQGCTCAGCRPAGTKPFTFGQATHEQRLPHADCQTPPCGCWMTTATEARDDASLAGDVDVVCSDAVWRDNLASPRSDQREGTILFSVAVSPAEAIRVEWADGWPEH
ncbi:UvrD-helicase domain-containing protein [Actinoplanes sp. M2I2]|uniref:UvrD-helicase domain-containing protein n=1 Tax=Actinoplanes sp. M2I2 TaxID=1734444 RepID=UPI00201FFF23|nr:UvrD-helicase domain-containing protein [Actinoplanes sp. M2I2]